MIVSLILLVFAFAVLFKASDYVVDYAVKFSKDIGVNHFIIGFFLLAVGTSLPELVVSVTSSLSGTNMSLANLIGSNIVDLALILGIVALFGFRLSRKQSSSYNHCVLIIILLSSILLILRRLDASTGLFLIVVFLLFFRATVRGEKNNKRKRIKKKDAIKSLAIVLVGLLVTIVSARIIIDSSLAISDYFGVTISLIAATIVSIGTALPELSISISAIRKKNVDLALGNIIGSSIANISLLLGINLLIAPIVIDIVAVIALSTLIIASLIFMFMAERRKFGINDGIFLILFYIAYLVAVTTLVLI